MSEVIQLTYKRQGPYFPQIRNGYKTPYSEVVRCLNSLGYTCLIEEKDYRGIKKGVKSLCPKKHECNVKLRQLQKGHTCCRICGREKARKTNMERYGVANPMQSDAVKAKARQTNMKRYGGPSSMCDPKIREKARKTNIERYGVDNPMQSDEVKAKARKTNMQRYGGPNPICDPKIREKIKQTNIERYGGPNPMCDPKIREKIKQTNMKRYGGPAPLCDPKVLAKAQQTNIERYGVSNPMKSQEVQEKAKQTNIERYGGAGPMASKEVREKYKQTCLERYGVENVSQCPEIAARILKSSYYQKDYILPSKKIVKIQGYEGFCLDDLFSEGYMESDIELGISNIPVIDYIFNNVKRKYFPDIYIPRQNKIIEVKSRYTLDKQKEKNIAKAQACIDEGYDFEFRVYKEKGKLVEIIKDINDM